MHNDSAITAIQKALSYKEYVRLVGLHSHIGSQIFETVGFSISIDRVVEFFAKVKKDFNISDLNTLNIGGGFGIRYNKSDSPLTISQYITEITKALKESFSKYKIDPNLTQVVIEPGRAIIGTAGTTLYTISSIKDIPNIRKYVAVDGGMTDNPRPMLYQAVYECMVANKANESADDFVSIAGRCCESGDMLIWNTYVPKSTKPGDILAVSCTGGYNYSMASNYNRVPRPAVVLIKNGNAQLIVNRETYDDLIKLDTLPTWI